MKLSDAQRARLVQTAAPALLPGEEVLDLTAGSTMVGGDTGSRQRRAVIVLTEQRVIVFAKWIGGHDVQDYAFKLLTGVDHRKGLMSGQIGLRASGGGVQVSHVVRSDVERIAQAIRERMVLARAPDAKPSH